MANGYNIAAIFSGFGGFAGSTSTILKATLMTSLRAHQVSAPDAGRIFLPVVGTNCRQLATGTASGSLHTAITAKPLSLHRSRVVWGVRRTT